MENWHSATIAKFKTLPIESLLFIQQDTAEAAKIADKSGNPKAGQYWDEHHYASMELKKRRY